MAWFFQTFPLEVVAVVVTASLIAVLLTFLKWKFTYWAKRNVPTLPIAFLLGNMGEVVARRKHFSEMLRESYRTFKDQGRGHCGFYGFWSPGYVPIDLEIVKHILQKDFHAFVNRGAYYNEKDDPLSAHLVFLDDEKWRSLRAKLTPTFTSGRLKAMFPILVKCGEELAAQIDEHIARCGEALDVRDISGRFTTDVIGLCALGIDCNSLKDPRSEFYKYAKTAFEGDAIQNMKTFLAMALPRRFLNKLGMTIVRCDVSKFFTSIIGETVEYREKNNVHRNDFMHLLLQLKNRGELADDKKILDGGGIAREVSLTMNELSAQAFVFFVAGFETSSTTIALALFELANHPRAQEKLRDEIVMVLSKQRNEMTYEALNEMKYLEMVVNETLRKYPPIPMLPRISNEDYRVPGTDLLVEKGTMTIIPTTGIHYDPEYYPEPEAFRPERFSEENSRKRPPLSFLPFGEGPRICIGMRFALVQVKEGLVAILRNYRLSPNEKTDSPLALDPVQFNTAPKGGIWLNFEKM